MLGPFSHYVRPYRTRLVLGTAAIAVAQAAGAYIPKLLSAAVDSLTASSTSDSTLLVSIRGHLIDILILSCVVAGGSYLMRRLLGIASTRIEYDIRRSYFAHLIKMPLSFFQNHRTGDLMARATNDLHAVSVFFTYGLRTVVESVLILTFSIAMMSSIHWKLTIIVLLPLPLLCIVTIRMSAIVHSRFRAIQNYFGEISNFVQENLAGIRVVKSFVLREPQSSAFDRLNEEYLRRNYRYIRARGFLSPVSTTIASVGLGLNLLVGGHAVVTESLSIGQFVAFNAYLTLLIRPISNSGWLVDRLQRALVAMRRINEILAIKATIADKPLDGARTRNYVSNISMSGNIRLANVTFSYDESPVLHDIELDLPVGTTLGIIGRVGSGKTTLARLIPRLIEPKSGSVLIDGIDVRDWPLEELRRSLGYVSQSPFLFSTSVKNNIAYGVDEALEKDVLLAAEQSQMSQDLGDLESGIDTVVGERGVTLSGGQKQRCTLARALMRNPRILILDDSLSAVDTHTEETILGYLREFMKHRTTIVIAHRISTLRHVSHIITLDEGRIVERGDHESLVHSGGLYSELYERQQLTKELDNL